MNVFKTKLAIAGFILATGTAAAPTAAYADDYSVSYFNDGNGTCGYIACGRNGCSLIDTFPCPDEMSPNG